MRTALTIAGSDSGGGAGIQADIKTITMNGVYATSAVTALTAQNTMGVTGIAEVTPEFLGLQLDAIFTDIYPDAVKTGMVSSGELIKVIAAKLKQYKAKNIVVDPVMVATSGAKLISDEAVEVLKKELLPLADVITPNIPEAEVLSGITIKNEDDMTEAARIINEKFGCSVLCKGGHQINDANDLLYRDGGYVWFKGRRINNPNTHGTGCTLSSAIASNLAKGENLDNAVKKAKDYISEALAAMLDLGKGSGPLCHNYAIVKEKTMKLSDTLFLKTKDLWKESAEKPFVLAMAKGTLEEELFKSYTVQDYLYLMEYVEILKRIRSLTENAKVGDFVDALIEGILKEVESVHLPSIKKYGITEEEVKSCKKISAITDYLQYLTKCIDNYGYKGGLTALLQCSWLYAYIGETVSKKYAKEIASSPYRTWFEAYTSESYISANQTWIVIIDTLGIDPENEEAEEMSNIFRQCATYENKLWDALYEK